MEVILYVHFRIVQCCVMLCHTQYTASCRQGIKDQFAQANAGVNTVRHGASHMCACRQSGTQTQLVGKRWLVFKSASTLCHNCVHGDQHQTRSVDFTRAICVTASEMRRFKVWWRDISYPQQLKNNLRSRKMVKDRRVYMRRQVISLSFVRSCGRNLFSLYTVGLRSLLTTN